MSEIAKVIDEWNTHADSLENAIEKRDAKAFKFALRKGSRCFESFKKIADRDNGQQEIANREEAIEALAHKWRAISERIPPWMNEVKEAIDKNHSSRLKDKKLNQAYGYMKKIGLNLQVKAN